MFWLKYFFKNLALAARLIAKGDFSRVFLASYARLYRKAYDVIFRLKAPSLKLPAPEGSINVVTDHRVAFTSPDHVAPLGTKYDNSTNGKFVLYMSQLIRKQIQAPMFGFMDLGCSGGQLVADFRTLGWLAVGLEGSDYSLKQKRANWAHLANKNLFTCDVTKPFEVEYDGKPARFHLITMWEVLEHIRMEDLPQLFENIQKHLADGGYFIASTASGSSVVDGIELHQTQWKTDEWHKFIASRFPHLKPARVDLKIYQFVRYDFGEPSFLIYRKEPVRSRERAAVAELKA